MTDVDSHLQRAGRHDGFQAARFQAFLHLRADLPGEGAVVRVGDRPGLIFVYLQGDLFGQAAAVGEEEGRLVVLDLATEYLGQRIPDLLAVL